MVNDGTLVFNRSGDRIYHGVVSGSGGVVNDGSILRLSAQQTYTGPTTINSGILVLPITVSNGLSDSTAVSIATGTQLDISNHPQTFSGLTGDGTVYSFPAVGGSGGHLTLNLAEDQTFSGDMGGAFPNFALTKAGTGSLILSGVTPYTGATTISQGSLVLPNGLPQSGGLVTVDGGGTLSLGANMVRALTNNGSVVNTGGDSITLSGDLRGNGQFNGDFLWNATTRPGTSTGLLEVDGDLALGSTHTLEVEIGGTVRGTEFDAINVTGAVALNGTLRVLLFNDFVPSRGDAFTIVSATTYSGEFTSLDLSGASLPAHLRWDASELSTTGTLRVRGRTFAEWADDFSLEANAGDDLLGEGVPLLVKYVLGLDPTVRANRANLPDFTTWTEGASEYLAVRVVRDPAVENVTITAEISANLETWSESDVLLIEDTDTVQHFRDSDPLGTHVRRFLRLRFTLEAEE